MKNTVSALCAILWIGAVHGLQLFIGDLCTIQSTESQGECKLLNDCPKALQDLQESQRFPQTCGFQGTQPIVCCVQSTSTSIVSPTIVRNRIAGEVSKQKCKEYTKYLYENKKSPILLIDAPKSEKNECGHKVVTLIVGGEQANRREFPHMAAIGYEDVSGGDVKWLCAGSIISEQYILTAGHCLNSREFGLSKYVRIGVTNLKDRNHLQEFSVAERIRYPEYTPSSHYNDIGLIKVNKRANLNPYAVPACLYTDFRMKAKKAIASGWGRTSFTGITSDDLLKVTLDLFSQPFCNNSYRNQISRKLNQGIKEDTQMCAGSTETEKDTCQGDSGGPLQIFHDMSNDNVSCMYDIVGVTSFGKACSGSPGVYTRVSAYIKWIEDIVWP